MTRSAANGGKRPPDGAEAGADKFRRPAPGMTTSQLTRPTPRGAPHDLRWQRAVICWTFSAETADVAFNNNGANTGGFEAICGGSGNDTITNAGSLASVCIVGLGGNDVLTGGEGER